MIEHDGVDAVWLLDVGEVSGVRYHGQGGPGDGLVEVEGGGWWGDRVVATRQHEGGCLDGGELAALVHGGDGLAAAGVALGIARRQHRRYGGTLAGPAGQEPGREPPSEQRRQQHARAL